jgi:SanA protein
MRFLKNKYFRRISILCLLFCGLMFWANHIVVSTTEPFIYSDIVKVPYRKTAVLLGTSKFLRNGKKNDFFFNRIDATVLLFKNHKIDFIIISGDNSTKEYNEPAEMQKELIKRGIPKNKIYLDFAGFRTLDSAVRAKKIFDQNDIVFISQKFHNERAIYLAREFKMNAIGFNAKDVQKYAGLKTHVREYFARVKLFIDLWFGVEPKFLGPKIKIP